MRLGTDGENPSNRYLHEFSYRFNRRYWPSELSNRLLKATVAAPAVGYAELTA
jgi:hypothetical protein